MLTSKIEFNVDRLKNKLSKVITNNASLEVGFFKSSKYPTGIPVAMVAFWNNFGTSKMPPRPFFDNAVNANKIKWMTLLQAQIKANKGDIVKSLSIVGTEAKNDIADEITNLNSPPNSPSTILMKGSYNPLIDTGFMRDNVTFEVVK